MNGVWREIKHWKDGFDSIFISLLSMFTEENGRLTEVWSLARGRAKILKNIIYFRSFSGRSMATDDEIIRESQGMNSGAVWTKFNPLNGVGKKAVLKSNGKFINSEDKKVGRQRASLPNIMLWVNCGSRLRLSIN